MKEEIKKLFVVSLRALLFFLAFYLLEVGIRNVLQEAPRKSSVFLSIALILLVYNWYVKEKERVVLFTKFNKINDELEEVKESLDYFYKESEGGLLPEDEMLTIKEIIGQIDSLLRGLEHLEDYLF